jgi:hypothetical protein
MGKVVLKCRLQNWKRNCGKIPPMEAGQPDKCAVSLLIHGFSSQCLPFENPSRVLCPWLKDGKGKS